MARQVIVHSIWWLLTFLCTYVTPVLADPDCSSLPDVEQQKPLSLIELTDIGLRCNPTTAAAWQQVKSNYADLGLAKSAYWPQLAGSVNWNEQNHTNSNSASINTGSNTNRGNGTTYSPNISLNFLLWDFGNRAAKLNTAKLQYQAANLSYSESIQQLILQIEQTYYQAIGQQALAQANQENVYEAKTSLVVAKALHQQGLATQGDIYQAESALAQAELNLAQTQGAQQIAMGQLLATLGIPLTTHITLASMPERIDVQPLMQSLVDSLDYAKQHRPDLLAAEAQAKAAYSQLLAVKSQSLPTLQMTANAGKIYPLSNTTGGSFNNLNFTLSIPLFTGFAQHYAEQQAAAQVKIADAQQKNLAQQVAYQTWQAFYNLQTSAKSLTNSDSLLKSSEHAAKQAAGQYKAGVGNILTVLTTQATAAQARAQVIQSKLNWYTTLATLAAALGNLDLNYLTEQVTHETIASDP